MSYGADLLDRLVNSLREALSRPSMQVEAYPDPFAHNGFPYASIQIGAMSQSRLIGGPIPLDDVEFSRPVQVRVVVAHYHKTWDGQNFRDAMEYLEDMQVFFNTVNGMNLMNEIDTTGAGYLAPDGLVWETDTGWRSFAHPYSPDVTGTQWGFEVTFRATFMKPVS